MIMLTVTLNSDRAQTGGFSPLHSDVCYHGPFHGGGKLRAVPWGRRGRVISLMTQPPPLPCVFSFEPGPEPSIGLSHPGIRWRGTHNRLPFKKTAVQRKERNLVAVAED